MEKLRIYQPKINSHIFSSNAHPDAKTEDKSEVKVWNNNITL